MRREQQLELGGQAITVHELTVGEVRVWLADAEGQVQMDADGTPDVVALWLLDDCTFGDLRRMSSATREQLDSLTDSQLRALVDACKGLNPGFFGMRARLMALGQSSLAALEPPPASPPRSAD